MQRPCTPLPHEESSLAALEDRIGEHLLGGTHMLGDEAGKASLYSWPSVPVDSHPYMHPSAGHRMRSVDCTDYAVIIP